MSDALDAAGAAGRDAAKRIDRRIPSQFADEGRYVPAGKAAMFRREVRNSIAAHRARRDPFSPVAERATVSMPLR